MAKKKSTTKEPKDYTVVRRAGFIAMFSGSLATSAYLGILVASPDYGQYALAGFNAVSAVFYFTKAVK